jgi:hypothetical protein
MCAQTRASPNETCVSAAWWRVAHTHTPPAVCRLVREKACDLATFQCRESEIGRDEDFRFCEKGGARSRAD